MKANEIRIGNLLYPINRSGNIHLPDDNPLVVMEVSQIHIKSHPLDIPVHKVLRYDNFHIIDLSRIPLTEEWLLKFGFIKCDGRHGEYFKHSVCELFRVWTNDGVNFSIGRKDEESFDRNYNTYWIQNGITEVHIFQNLFFYTTGKELVIK